MKRRAALRDACRRDLGARIVALLEERKKLERELAEARKQTVGGSGAPAGVGGGPTPSVVNGIKLAARARSSTFRRRS